MEKYFVGKKLVGIKIKKIVPGSTPVTGPDQPVQVLTLKHTKGETTRVHFHTPVQRVTTSLQECLVVLKGKIRIDLYGASKKRQKKVIVRSGETFIIVSGINSVHYLEDSEVIEIKNGPFVNDTVHL